MDMKSVKVLLFHLITAVNIHCSLQNSNNQVYQKAAYKSGEILDMTPVTLNRIKEKLRVTGVFDEATADLTGAEKKELNKLYEAVEIMTTSRARQPSTVQNMFSSLRIVERALKKQLKEGQLSESLAAKFHWNNLSVPLKRNRRSKKITIKRNNEKSFRKVLQLQ